ncbi:N-6 DNA methylase [Micromonospora deserti]|uniref:N-6 DNA methylase n=1 Tax=Micromonospora deserti TaxID=2070366 RepID=A0A2W2DG18_9ACTN|nr:N-6 DNA methylase [Micromonospora deserti]PZG02869.1 N-6 DNA methylase [Micromonospora deserti]
MPRSADSSITLAEIARIAGVGRAAVSNWRRRHGTFPTPVGGSDASPQFSLADVEAWLRQHGKLQDVGRLERLWPQIEAVGDRALSGYVIAAVGRRVQERQIRAVGAACDLTGDAGTLVNRAADVAAHEGGQKTFDFLFTRWMDKYVRQVSVTPPQLASLMIDVGQAVLDRGIEGQDAIVFDPACGTGSLLLAAAQSMTRNDPSASGPTLLGVERDPVPASLAAVRLGFIGGAVSDANEVGMAADIRIGDSLRKDPHVDVRADLVVCNPPFNERDWGHEELATDPRWTYGLPPRTESELAWVEHVLARLRPGGVAVLLLPPAVASRRAGRRIRGALLRSGALRGIIALPAGSAQPHSISLHLWILQAPGLDDGPRRLFLLDSGAASVSGRGAAGIDWPRLHRNALRAISAYHWGAPPGHDGHGDDMPVLPEGCAAIPVVELLDDHVDLTPARHVTNAGHAPAELDESWSRFGGLVKELGELSRTLSALDLSADDRQVARITVGDLSRAEALTLQSGQALPACLRDGDHAPADAVPALRVPDLMISGRARAWLSAADVVSHEAGGGTLTMVEPGVVIVVGVERAFRAWVHAGEPLVLGPQIYALRVDPALLDPWFLAGCLRAPDNLRVASTHTSTSAKIDVRKLQVLQMPLVRQRHYGRAFRAVVQLEAALAAIRNVGEGLLHTLGDQLAAGKLSSS